MYVMATARPSILSSRVRSAEVESQGSRGLVGTRALKVSSLVTLLRPSMGTGCLDQFELVEMVVRRRGGVGESGVLSSGVIAVLGLGVLASSVVVFGFSEREG